MKFNFRIIKKYITKEPYYDELFFNPYIEIIKMKFLNCNYSEDIDADIVLECFDSNYQDYLILYCPHCNDGDFFPEDVYDQIKGNFFYDVKK